MARLNIEDDFFLEIIGVVAKIGDQDAAIGNAVRFLRFAQERHKKGKSISEDEFREQGFSEALIPHFAKRTPSGIQAVGAKKHFGWLEQKVEAGRKGGQKSAKRPRDNAGRMRKLSPQIDFNPSELQASPSPSLSYSDSTSDSRKNPSGSAKKANAFIAAYSERFKLRWGVNPQILPKHAGIAKRVAKGLSGEKIGLYMDAYFSLPDSWLVKTKHPIEAFESKIGEIVVFVNDGTFTSRREANQADGAVALASQIDLIRSGGLV